MADDSMKAGPTPMEKRSGFRVLWACALCVSFLISVFAAFRGGYIGGDYNTHLERILNAGKLFDFSVADPPIFVLVSQELLRFIGRNNGFVITLSIIQAAINALALWWFFLYSERRFKSPLLHLSLILFLTFLPVRIIHAASIGPDWLTIPVFVLVLFLFDKFLSEETSTPKNAAFLGLALALGIWSKYSFMALLPAIFVIFAFLWWRRAWNLKRFVTICALSLVLPSALVLYSSWQSFRVQGFTIHRIWLPKEGVPGQPEMNYKDLFSVKAADLELFKAPEEFKREPSDEGHYHVGFRRAHQHSYLGLSHMGIFTDPMNLFQDLPGPQSIDRFLHCDFKTRRPWKTAVMVAAMSLGTLWTVLALAGTPWIFCGAVKDLWRDKLEREDATAFLGIAYFLLMFLPIPFVYWGCLYGYWMPRLILPSLLCFSWAGFLLLDRTIGAKSEKVASVVLAFVIVQSGIEIVTLI
jgi:4-amino-4-deoxy-L-arabinose transferase-like glycosyltransferase